MGNKRKNDKTILNNNLYENIRFKKLSKKNYEDILKIYNHYILATTVLYDNKPLNVSQLTTRLQLNNKKTIGYTIFFKSELCGFCLLRPFWPDETNLNIYQISIYLKEDYIGKGIGKYALEYIENIAKELNIISLIASISSENHISINFFEKNGYVKCGHFIRMGFKFDHFIDNLYYQKIL